MVPIFGKFMSYITREKSSSKETKLRRAVQPGLTAENIRYDSPFPLDITTGAVAFQEKPSIPSHVIFYAKFLINPLKSFIFEINLRQNRMLVISIVHSAKTMNPS